MDVEDTKRLPASPLFQSLPKADTLCTGNVQEPPHDMKRKSGGRLRPFLKLIEFLDGYHASYHSPNSRRLIAMINQHEKFGEFGGGSQISSTKATEIPALIHLFWLKFKLEDRDQKADAQVYHNSKLPMSFSRRIST